MKKNFLFLIPFCILFISCRAEADSYDDVNKKYGSVKKIVMTGVLDENTVKELQSKMDAFPDNFLEVNLSSCTYVSDKYGFKGDVLSGAFRKRENLKKVVLGKDLNYVSTALFSDCTNLTQVVFPKEVSYFGYYVFNGCKTIKKIVMPEKIGQNNLCVSNFTDCPLLEELILPQDVSRFYHSESRSTRDLFPSLKTLTVTNYPLSFCNSYKGDLAFYPPEDSECKFDVIVSGKKKSYEEFYNDCSALVSKPVKLVNIRASSTLKDLYKAENLVSGDWKSWSEGEEGNGCGSVIEADFSEPTCVSNIYIRNGYGDPAYFFENNRVKKFEMILDDDESTKRIFTIADIMDPDWIPVNAYSKLYSKIRFTILDVYPGTNPANDTCLNEISINSFLSNYRYDDTTVSMFHQMYSMYERNVKRNEDDSISVLSSYDDMDSWSQGRFDWSGNFEYGSNPGTGGGHSYERYAIFLMEDGRHILIKFTETSYGIFQEYYPAHPEFFAWENKKWNRINDISSEKNLGEAGKLLDYVIKNDIDFKFYADEYSIYVRPMINYQNFVCEFDYDDYKILPYKRTPHNQAALGTVETLTAIPDWKNICGNDYETDNLLVLSAGFNRDPSMTQFLINEGYEINLKETRNSSGMKFYSPLEVCMAQFNDPAVKKILLENGASYTGQILVDAMDSHNLSLFREYAPLVKDYRPVLKNFYDYYCFRRYEFDDVKAKEVLPYYEQILSILKANNCDLNQLYSEGKSDYQNRTVMTDAIEFKNLDYIRLLVKYGYRLDLKNPELIEEIAKGYKDGHDDDERDVIRRKKQIAILDYVFSLGAEINPPENIPWYGVLQYMCNDRTVNPSNVEFCRYLIAHGADVNLRDGEGKSALDYVLYNNGSYIDYDPSSNDLFDLLVENGADLSGINMDWVNGEGSVNMRKKLAKLRK